MKAYDEYTRGQWEWAWQRFCEGYTIKEIASFLYVHRETVARHFRRLGLRAPQREGLAPLEERRGEFQALQQEAS